ncbi:MAG: DNA repair protein RecO [Ruminococcus sp.]|nr:DNA repair protein RecO [Ruminococcus sp.]
MKFRTDGLIIREQNIGENDRLVWVLTRSNGVVKAFARGAKKLTNAKCSATSLLAYSRLTIYKSRESYMIGDAQTLRIFSKLRHDVKDILQSRFLCVGNIYNFYI